jgi:hypothetical protein
MPVYGVQPAPSPPPCKLPYWRRLTSHRNVPREALTHAYAGTGTASDPRRVGWLPLDPVDPLNYPGWVKWAITVIMALSTLAVTFASSGLSGAHPQLMAAFGASTELVTAEVALFVLAFAVGPAVWAPLSELYGRQVVFAVSFAGATLFSGLGLASPNIGGLIALRFLSGAFGASALTNAAGVITDLFIPQERGLGK